MGTPIFLVKRASNSQDTVDYIVQRAARKNSSGFPGLTQVPNLQIFHSDFTCIIYIFQSTGCFHFNKIQEAGLFLNPVCSKLQFLTKLILLLFCCENFDSIFYHHAYCHGASFSVIVLTFRCCFIALQPIQDCTMLLQLRGDREQ